MSLTLFKLSVTSSINPPVHHTWEQSWSFLPLSFLFLMQPPALGPSFLHFQCPPILQPEIPSPRRPAGQIPRQSPHSVLCDLCSALLSAPVSTPQLPHMPSGRLPQPRSCLLHLLPPRPSQPIHSHGFTLILNRRFLDPHSHTVLKSFQLLSSSSV